MGKLRQPSRYKCKDQLQSQATTYEIEILIGKCSGRKVLQQRYKDINSLIGETETQ